MGKVLDAVNKEFVLPYQPYKFQAEIIEKAVEHKQSLLRMDVGTGKTVTAWFTALYASLAQDIEQILILCPPVLIPQWFKYVQDTQGIPSVAMYRGTIKQREKMNLDESVVIMSYGIFKRDFDKIYSTTENRKVFVIADEVSLKDVSTQIYKKFRKFVYQKVRPKWEEDIVQRFSLLNATPISSVEQTYAWIKILTPEIYSSEKYFRSVHVEREDFFGKPIGFKHLEMLEDNFSTRAFHVDAEDVIDLPEIVYTPLHYELSDEHYDIYNALRDKEFYKLTSNTTILQASAMFNALQRCVTCPGEFGYSPKKSATLEILDEQLKEIGDEKVILFSNYKVTNRSLLNHLGDTAVGLWGEISPKDKEKALLEFSGPLCNRVVANPRSGGVGLNLQHANRIIFVETPLNPSEFKQSVGRIHREGQKKRCFVTILLAAGTIQEKIYYRLIQKDVTLNEVMKSRTKLRELLY